MDQVAAAALAVLLGSLGPLEAQLSAILSAALARAGAISPLVALLSGGPESEAAEQAAWTLGNLAMDDAGRAVIAEAGAIPPLVALLSGGPESKAAGNAARALVLLACSLPARSLVVLEEVARTQASCSSWPDLQMKLSEWASARLQAAEEGTDVAVLERAITLASAVPVDAAVLEGAQERLREMNGDAERQERRESFGLGSLALPDEFVCPITMDKMRGVPPPPSPPACIARAPPPRLQRLRRRPGGGVRRPLIRAVRHPLGAPRRQRLESAHPRAAPADFLREPCPEAAHAGPRRRHAGCGGHRCGERQRRDPAASGPRCRWQRAVERACSKAEPSRSVSLEGAVGLKRWALRARTRVCPPIQRVRKPTACTLLRTGG